MTTFRSSTINPLEQVACATISEQHLVRNLAILFFSALAAVPGAAQQGKSPEDVIVTGERPREKKICTRVVPTGSIMPQTICQTQEQVEYERVRSLSLKERMRNERIAEDQLRVNLHEQ
jgi:hypothetical protein